MFVIVEVVFFFKQKTAYEMRISDWSSDVCSSDLPPTEADVVLWAIGQVQPNTGWLPAHLLDDRGFVLVEPTLAVSGQDHIFAVGDIAAVDALRTSARNQGHKLVGRNVRAHVAGRSLGRSEEHTSELQSLMRN